LYYDTKQTVEHSEEAGHPSGVAEEISGPRCMARFDYEGTETEDLGFIAGDVIRLKDHVGDEWLRGELNGRIGVFPAAFVEIIEHLPTPTPGKHISVIRLDLGVEGLKYY